MDKLFVLAQTWGLISIPKYDLGEAADVVREEQKHRSSLTHWESSRLPLVSHGVLISRHADHTRPSSKTSSAGPAGDDTQGLSSTHFGGSLKKKKKLSLDFCHFGSFQAEPYSPKSMSPSLHKTLCSNYLNSALPVLSEVPLACVSQLQVWLACRDSRNGGGNREA